MFTIFSLLSAYQQIMAPNYSNSNNNCIKCRRIIPGRDFLRCCDCKNHYDIECANVSEKLFQSMTPEKKTAFKCRACLDSCFKPASTACLARQGTASQVVINEKKTKVSPATSHVTRSKTRSNSTELPDLPASASGDAAPAESYITESRLTEILKRELGSTIRVQVSGQLSMIQDQITSFHDSFTYFNPI